MDNGIQVGQNLFLSRWAPTGTRVADDWYSEIEHYNYDNVDKGKRTAGHFTQMVWKSTKQIGCAVAVGPWK